MNKNPERPNNMDNIISECLNPQEPEEPQHKKAAREVLKAVFGE